ncbi:MAG: hypothetical protein QN138_00300 [Armatimonadota bacterium]|nr:hypothetical protein [Armatimonadota bacterium]MDR5688204.1 hypothetical protein [Armatimonadota bacterium]
MRAATGTGAVHAESRRTARLPLLVPGGLSLLVGMWVGLRRAGWPLPELAGAGLADHAALMISGFLGTLIALERAAALRRTWTFLAPALSGVGAVALLAGLPHQLAVLLFALSGAALSCAYLYVFRLQPAPFTTVMAAGGAAWLLGTLAWGAGLPVAAWVTCWAGFLVLTIVGERLELSRLTRLPRWGWHAFAGIALLHGAASLVSLAQPVLGLRLSGAAFVAWALWLARFDVARRTVRTPGLPRFAAVALLSAYAWLLVAGLLWLSSPGVPAGLRYDAEIHALFLGFVFSMVFAHAPIIWPSVLGGEIRFSPRIYGHLLLLHFSLLLRVAAGLAAWGPGRRWAVVLNTAAVLLFLRNTVRTARSGPEA